MCPWWVPPHLATNLRVGADDSVEMSFIQNYKSDRTSDVGKKVLIWKDEGDSWKIVKESWKPSEVKS